ncbi:hypothetical protein [Lactococcus sp. DD01]|uniref:hypothetical protein n=1 Tax=Lactococcus sp. DD01 TaxID=1776443 RepID=UPI0007763B0B|nr:hypothetical protein [Lactococcus sp. DD01]
MFNFNEESVIKKERFGREFVQIPLVSMSKNQLIFNKYSIETFELGSYKYIQFMIQNGMLAMKFSNTSTINSYKITKSKNSSSINVSAKNIVNILSEKYLSNFKNGIKGRYSFRLKQESQDVFYIEISKGEFKIIGTR